ncbi:transcript variant X3 [Nothobranchius furzeri]|uniref:Transcript variant X1 n=4 Tax=Nothobranchius TaxID=28779 RepID=A0A9D2Y2Z1_NOTFU|nr:transcript variant X1 [Nothobranchius furzeri]KAF7212993.1 transcript variant X2 [Nothobranchius furzeri]KAF7212994.1 transcript variant X3 [Nothobranchius furzeri]
MSNNQQNFRARIQAFESQADAKEGNASQIGTPSLPPRTASCRPPVAAKPSAAFRSTSLDDTNKNEPIAQNPQNPFTGSKAQPPVKPVRQSLRNELEAFHSKGNTSNSPNPFALTSTDGFEEEEPPLMSPIPPLKPFKEPLKPNLNINIHNSASMFTNNNHLDNSFSNPPVKPQFSMDDDGVSINRPSIGKRPTTIRVPSMTGSVVGNFQDSGHPLPTQKPVSPLTPSASYKQITKSSMSLQNSFGVSPTPLLPPRKPTMEKSLPPRPSLVKAGPGRQLPSTLQATDQSQSKPPAPKKGLILPPRPCPGHRLYNKYTLQLPHGIASFDYDGSDSGHLTLQKNEVLLLLNEINRDEFECQVGETTGRVHKYRMKVITPLGTPPLQGASGGDDCGLTVQALYDFDPENPGELRLREGDFVTDVEQLDNQWYQGTCDGSTGYFPVNYAKVLSNSPKSLPKKKTKPKPATISGPRCVAIFNFDGEHSDELSFSEGEMIQLKELVGEDWARGQIGTSIGIFPLNFVDIIEDLPPSRNQLQSSKVALPGVAASPCMQSEAAKPVQASKPSAEWATALYDYAAISADELSFQQGDRILITDHINEEWSSGRLGGREGMFPRAFIKASSVFAGQAPNGAAGGERARALYSYTSDCEEELSIRVGDIITNLESVDEEWFLGDLRGKRALVPKNYVKVLK